MEIKLRKVLVVLGVAGVGYYLYTKMKKPAAGAVTDKVTTNKVKSSAVTEATSAVPATPVAASYPDGYFENDYVRNPSGDGTVYMLKRGQKLPITYAWWMANAKNDWDSVKDMGAPLLMDIPTGNTLDA